jgi:enoyl-CoA hydratase/carnithine racemase
VDYQEIQYAVADYIATITLNRPDKLNAWTFTMEREYRHALCDAEARDDVRVIILTGAGRGFCAGADISLLTSVQDGTLSVEDATMEDKTPGAGPDVPEDYKKTYTFPPAVAKPVIAAINGHAMGLGLVHALYCDLRIASDNAKFGTAFVQRGLIAEHGIAWMLPRLIGIDHALDLLMSGRIVMAEEAKTMGLVTKVVPHDALMATAHAYATHLATQCSPRSIGIMKKQVYRGLLMPLGEAVDEANREMMESFGCEDFVEGVSSFLERRPPNFSGK